jgi:hypothetical protein
MTDITLECVKRGSSVPVGTYGVVIGGTVEPVACLKLRVEPAKVLTVPLDDLSKYWRARKST